MVGARIQEHFDGSEAKDGQRAVTFSYAEAGSYGAPSHDEQSDTTFLAPDVKESLA